VCILLRLSTASCILSSARCSTLCNHMCEVSEGDVSEYVISKESQQDIQNHTPFSPSIQAIFYLNGTRRRNNHKTDNYCAFQPPIFVEPIIYIFTYWTTHIDILKPPRIHPTQIKSSIILKSWKQFVKSATKRSRNRYFIFITPSVGILF